MANEVSIDSLPRTSGVTIKRFRALGIETYFDLYNYFPTRYENYSLRSEFENLQPGEIVTVEGTITAAKNSYARRGLVFQRVTLTNKNGKNIEVVWYNQPFLIRMMQVGAYLSVAGLVKQFGNKISLEPREYEILHSEDQERIHTGRIVPIYSGKYGLSARTIRDKMYLAFKTPVIEEPFPPEFLKRFDLPEEMMSYKQIHFPTGLEHISKAKDRLSFDELFFLELSNKLIKREWEKKIVTMAFKYTLRVDEQLQKFISSLPYKLTTAQLKAWNEIREDLSKPHPMNRFLQGDVGSGKTVVATLAAYFAYLNNLQTVFMAPTEILATQHFETVSRLMKPFGVKVGLQTRTSKIIKKGTVTDYDIIIGTQAVVQKSISFEKVGLVVIDEQHRFGVAQRAILKEKGKNPHLLTMTATPIPRTVALLLYGELAISILNEMPKGRLPVKTYLVPDAKKKDCYDWIRKRIKEHGEQVFVVCPLIEESEVETMQTVKAAEKEYERLRKDVFPDIGVSLVHGKLKTEEKQRVMQDFKEKKSHILVTTSVVEVGIDIADATVMLVEGADRFGLAQLHQLRGRVGRRDKQSYCFLFSDKKEEMVTTRLKYFAQHQSGMEIAEFDFKKRGPGELFGVRQHGYIDLKIADIADIGLIKRTKEAVDYYLSKGYPIDQSRLREIAISRD